MKIPVIRNILETNELIALENRKLFKENKILVLNLISSPGAGKTSLLERTIEALQSRIKIGVIEGDIQTNIDAKKISKKGVATVQINTGGACHLDGNMIRATLKYFDLKAFDLLIIENVGNLVCPAEFDTGESHKVVILSVPEGDDKPLKYPLVFHISSVLVINKIDLLPYLDCKLSKLKRFALKVNPKLKIFEVSCKTGEGLSKWYRWIEEEINANK